MAQGFKLLFVLWLVAACLEATAGSSASPPTGSTASPPPGSTASPPTGSTASPPTGSTASPPTGSTASPPTGSTASPPTGSTASPPTVGSTASPPTGSTASPPTGSTASPPTGSSASPPTGSTASPPTGSTASPPTVGSTASPPTGSTASPPPGSTASPPTGSTASPPTGSSASPPTGSTASPPTVGSTASPPTGSTASPPTVGSTASPPTVGSTASPPTGSTASPPTVGSTASPPTGSTAAPPTGSTASPPTGSTASPAPPFSDPCAGNPCGRGSTCEPRADEDFVCLCLAGDFYNNVSRSCETAKVFPGQLSLPRLAYSENMSNKTSKEFLNASQQINHALSVVFSVDDFSGSIVLELTERSASTRVGSRSGNGVDATVEIIFTATSDITTEVVLTRIREAPETSDSILSGATFKNENLCDSQRPPCDLITTECSPRDGFYNCTCKENYIKTDFSDRTCSACPSGQKAVDGKDCVNCPFGYSGLNCNESWQLALVIVGCVLGALLLITLILLPIVAHKFSKKSSKKNRNTDNEKPYINNYSTKAPLVDNGLANRQAASASPFANAGATRLPRATTTSSWDRRADLEMTPSNSRQNMFPAGRNQWLYEDADDTAPSAQTRSQNNPYAQRRPQSNPYTSRQGTSNPHYIYDD